MVSKKVVSSGNSTLKWVMLIVAALIIWRAVRTDSENFASENFASGKKEGFRAVHPTPSTPVPSQSSEMRFKTEGSCGTPASGSASGSCSADGKGSCVSPDGTKLLPVLDPCFNMREICKQSILLEDHLFQANKRCTDCIKKHFLTMEGLSEEAITLDKKNEYNLSKYELPEFLRKLQKQFLNNEDPESIAQQLRQVRKPLMAKFFDRF